MAQMKYLRQTVCNQVPEETLDFTTVLPRIISLYIFSFLDPRSLCRCAQVYNFTYKFRLYSSFFNYFVFIQAIIYKLIGDSVIAGMFTVIIFGLLCSTGLIFSDLGHLLLTFMDHNMSQTIYS